MRRRYEEELRAASIAQGISIEGSSPLRNAAVVSEELKKSVITMLFGDAAAPAQLPFVWNNLINVNIAGEPSIAAGAAADRAPIIQFLEQAFEWEKMTYIFYPYFWADHATAWTTLAPLDGPDPEYVRFLRAGSARVVVSARPGFEHHVKLFVHCGKIWSGGSVPSPQDPDYLSIADEIRAMNQAPDEGEPLDWWDARLPTTLVWLEGATPLPVKPKCERELGECTGATSGRPLAIRTSLGQRAIAGSFRPVYIGTWLVLGPIFDPRHQVDDHFNDRQMGQEAEHPWANDIIMAIDQHTGQLDPVGITADLQRSPKDGNRIFYGGDPSKIFAGRVYIWRRRSFRGLDWRNINDVGDNIHLFLPADELAESYDPDNDLSFSHKHHALAFFLVYVHSRNMQTTDLLVRSDDALRVWLNGSEIVGLRWTHEREIDETETSCAVRLNEGWNVLLLAVAETHVEWGLSARFENAEGLRFSAVHPDWLYSSTPSLRIT
jgi:hypothetical protein